MGFIEFAPLSLPFSRRLETVGVLCWLLMWSMPWICISLTAYVLFFTNYWYIAALYLGWIYYDRDTRKNGGRRWDLSRRAIIWKWYTKYFPLRLVKTSDLDPSKNYLLACHPHGILGNGLHGNLASEGNNISKVFPQHKINFLTLDANFFIPIFREFCSWQVSRNHSVQGGGCSGGCESMNALLSKPGGGNLVTFVPGGARESLYSHPGVEEVYLKQRKGFVKVAIQNGSPIIPLYSFGETEVYSQLPNPKGSLLRTIQDKCIDRIGVPFTMINGRGIFQYSFGPLPRRHPITSVVGSPIEVRKLDNPPQEYVDKVHAQYIEALRTLYNKHYKTYGNPNAKLIIS